MKTFETVVYAALLVAAAAFSWASWKGEEPEKQVGSVIVFDGGAPSRIVWEGDTSAATLAISGSGDDAEVWLTAGRREKLKGEETPEPARDDDDSGDDDDSATVAELTIEEPAEPEYGPPKLTSFPGNGQATDLVGKFAPLEALRQFDGLGEQQLADMGLDAPEAVIRVQYPKRELTLEVGGKAYGSSDAYVRRVDTGAVYLLSSKVLGPLRSADTRLMDRDILGIEPTEAKAATVNGVGVGVVQAAHQGTHDKDNAYWSRPETPDDADAELNGFIEKVFKLRASEYLGEDEAPGLVQPQLSVAFTDGDEPLLTLELGRSVNAERSKPGEPVFDWFAKTERSRGAWVKVSRGTASELAEALPSLMEG